MSAGGAAVRLDPLERALALAGEALAALLGAEMALRWLPWLAARLPALLLLLLWSGLRARRLSRAARGDAAPWLREGQVRDALLLLAAALAGLAGRPDGAALAGFALLLLGHLAALPSGRRLALLAAAGAAAAALAVAALLAVAPLRRGLERLLLDLILGAGWLLGEGVALLVGLLRRLAGGGPGAAPVPPPAPAAAGRAQPAWAGSLAGGLAILLLGAAGLLLAALGARLLLGRLRAPESPEEREAREGIRILRSRLEEPPGRRPPRPAPTRLRRAYQRLERALRAAGMGRPAAETPLRFAGRPLPLPASERRELAELTGLYVGHRYGGEPDASPAQLRTAADLLRAIRRRRGDRRGVDGGEGGGGGPVRA